MEKKTIGSFIGTLRNASGLTQKQLAEMLMVTDKTVSRWERDETLPDLTLIPVIAEIFGVTSDELLRGERKVLNTVLADSRGEKQLRRILIGCALGLIANMAAAVYQRVGTINAMAAIDSEEFAGGQVNEIKKEIIRSEATVMKTVIIVSSVVVWLATNSGGGLLFVLIAACICWIISDSTRNRIKKIKKS